MKLRSGLPVAATALFVLLALAAPARAGDLPTKFYRDATHKFSLKMFDKWDQIPIEAGQETTVAKFTDKSDRGDAFTTDIEVVRIAKGDKGKPVITEGDQESAEDAFRDAMRPKSAWAATIERLNLPKEKLPKPEAKSKKVVSADDVVGKLYAFDLQLESRYVGRPPVELFVSLATFEKDDIEYGLFLTCSKARAKSLKVGFEQIAKSFKFFDQKAKDVETLTVLDGVNISPKRRREIERGKIKGWDVMVSPKKQYIVIYDTKNGKNHLLADTIAKRIELIRAQIYEVQFPPAQPITSVSVVRVCRDQKQYFAYGGPPGSAGYWNSGDEELVFYDASASKKIDDNTVAVLYHEAFHQYIYYSVGSVAPHSWFNEGHGDYYAGARFKNGKFTIGPFSWRTSDVKGAIVQGPRPFTVEKNEQGEEETKWGSTGYTPLKDLVRFSQGEYYSYATVSYAQGWSLVYFLREIVPKNKKWNEKWGKILTTYFDTLKAEVNKSGDLKPGGDEKPDGKDDPEGNGDPGKDDPEGNGDPGGPDAPGGSDGPAEPPGEPGDGAPGDGEPGNGEPGDGAPGKGEPGDGDPPSDPGDGEPLPENFIPPSFLRGLGGGEALKKAADAAFKDVDWDEFEKAWRESIKGVSG